MRWVTYVREPEGVHAVGLLTGTLVHELRGNLALVDLLGDDGEKLARAAERAVADPAEVTPLNTVTLLSPIPRPPSIRDFASFEQHIRNTRARNGLEMEPTWYQRPTFYFSNPHAAVGHGSSVAIPPNCEELDFELEVAAIMGRAGSNVRLADADKHIAGFCIMNDWSARDVQRIESRLGFGPAKSKDFATTIGPYLVTPDELSDRKSGESYDLLMTATINGREYSRASLADMYWHFDDMIEYAARSSRIEVGDIIGSGTCSTGCILELSYIHPPEEFPWLTGGDLVELTVERLGTLANRVSPATR